MERDERDKSDDRAAQDDAPPLIVRSSDLLQGRREIWIEHQGHMYRLRATRTGKLHLSK